LTALVLVHLAGCGSWTAGGRAPSEGARAGENAIESSAPHAGRWLRWRDGDRTWGSFVTTDGAGPHWPLDVAGSAGWSEDGRWLVSCAPGFVAARWMGSARPSKVAVLGGGCSAISWAPSANAAVALSRDSQQLRLLTFAPGEEPRIAGADHALKLAERERLDPKSIDWSPAGTGFTAMVSRPGGGWSIRWVDTVRTPGTVRSLVTDPGFEAGSVYPNTGGHSSCWWSPNGVTLACRVWQEAAGDQRQNAPREALALFDLAESRVSSRHLFEGRGFWLRNLGWLGDHHLVFTDRDATRLLDLRKPAPPLVLSAAAGAFAIAPTNRRIAYVNHRGLCLRDEAEGTLGPERVVLPREVKGVTWSPDGRHLSTRRADGRALIVVLDAAGKLPRIEETEAAPPGLEMFGQFSRGSTLLFTRAGPSEEQQRQRPIGAEPKPLVIRSLADFEPVELVTQGLPDFLSQSPDDAAVVLGAAAKPNLTYLSLMRKGRPSAPLRIGEPGSFGFEFQPGAPLTGAGKPAPKRSSDPRRERVPLPPDHPISLATAYVRGSMECTGALIDTYYVVTAHHCVEKGSASVVLGRNLAWEQKFDVPPHRILHHPDARYVERIEMFEHDLAVLELPSPAPPRARSFSLASADEAAPGTEVFLSGFGGDYTVGLGIQPELRYSISTLVPAGESVPATIRWRSAEGADNGNCLGDSGGPISVRRGDGTFALLGIHFGIDTTDYGELCRNWGVAGKLSAERAWLDAALTKLSMSRRGSGPPRAR
jgi:hypothetical protein